MTSAGLEAMETRLADVQPTFDVFSLAKVLWAMVSGSPKFRLWYFDRPENDLRQMFPEEPGVQFVHEILRRCVVEFEDRMAVRDASELLGEIDTAIAATSHGCQLPGPEPQAAVPVLRHDIRKDG